jgi:hypothetical protein
MKDTLSVSWNAVNIIFLCSLASDTTDETRILYFTPPLKTVFDEVKTHHIPMRTNFMEMQTV